MSDLWTAEADRIVRDLEWVSAELRSAGDVPLLSLNDDGVTTEPLTTADFLYSLACAVRGLARPRCERCGRIYDAKPECPHHPQRASVPGPETTQEDPADCIGNDPTCPCQDGDWCHYVDDPISGTKAMPIPSGVAPADTTEEPADEH